MPLSLLLLNLQLLLLLVRLLLLLFLLRVLSVVPLLFREGLLFRDACKMGFSLMYDRSLLSIDLLEARNLVCSSAINLITPISDGVLTRH